MKTSLNTKEIDKDTGVLWHPYSQEEPNESKTYLMTIKDNLGNRYVDVWDYDKDLPSERVVAIADIPKEGWKNYYDNKPEEGKEYIFFTAPEFWDCWNDSDYISDVVCIREYHSSDRQDFEYDNGVTWYREVPAPYEEV